MQPAPRLLIDPPRLPRQLSTRRLNPQCWARALLPDLDLLLRRGGVRNLVLCGITTDVCVSHP